MKVLLCAVGTRGDVQPALALALALRALGVTTRVCVPPNLVSWAESLGLDARPIGIAMRPSTAAPPTAEEARRLGDDLITDQFVVVAESAADCDVIVAAGAHQYAARSVAEARAIPCVSAAYAPVALPSTDLAPGGPDTGDPIQRWGEARAAWNARALGRVNAQRARLGLGPVDDVLGHILGDRVWLSTDPLLGPAPTSPERTVVQAGAWLLAEETHLPPEVEAFLADGEPPVYIGLGSMPAAPDAAHPIVAAARALGRRVLLSRGWADLAPVDDAPNVLPIGDVPHAALFPRLAAVVHHGGAGTTHSAALAGVPQVLLPMFGDQPYWASRVRALGIGTSTSLRGSTVATLTDALRTALGAQDVACALVPRLVPDGAERAAAALVGSWGDGG